MKSFNRLGKVIFTLILMLFVVNDLMPQAVDIYNGTTSPQVKEAVPGPVMAPLRDPVLYNNGGITTHTGTGYGGANISMVQNNTFGLSTLGFGHQHSYGYKIADDFTVPAGPGWNITGVSFYAYMTGSGTISPFTAVYFEIWDGDPMEPTSNAIFGDFVTNRLTTTGFSNIYRLMESDDLLKNNRAIMTNYCAFNLALGPGTYWIVWNTDGACECSGPWIPPVTVFNVNQAGNALQYTTGWGGAYDMGTMTQQAMPFVLYGLVNGGSVIPVAGWALGIGLVLIIGLAVLRYRRIL